MAHHVVETLERGELEVGEELLREHEPSKCSKSSKCSKRSKCSKCSKCSK